MLTTLDAFDLLLVKLMFNPLYYDDGRLCWFRIGCLTAAALCLLSFGVVKAVGFDSAAAQGGSGLAAARMVPGGSEGRKLELQRSHAINEMADGAQFLKTCGEFNEGFVNCKVEFSDEVKTNYQTEVNAFADGFAITLTAKGPMAKDRCHVMSVDSAGHLEARDEAGQNADKCFPDGYMKKDLTAFYRAADTIEGSAAPSGAQVLVQTAAVATAQPAVN